MDEVINLKGIKQIKVKMIKIKAENMRETAAFRVLFRVHFCLNA